MTDLLPALYVVATPLGNLEDITFRAVNVLKGVDFVLCEDTRRTRILFERYNITTRMVSFYEHNERSKTPWVIQSIVDGKRIALVSDGGTPCVSDPGYYLVRECVERKIRVIPVPGPSAVLSALVMAGFPMDRFVFEGFLPKRGNKRRKRLESIAGEGRTVVVYESPHRLLRLFEDLKNYLSCNRRVAVCREMTKVYEEVVRGTLEDVEAHFKDRGVKGEVVVVIEGRGK